MILYLVESTTKILVSQGDADVPGFSHRNTGCTGQDNDQGKGKCGIRKLKTLGSGTVNKM